MKIWPLILAVGHRVRTTLTTVSEGAFYSEETADCEEDSITRLGGGFVDGSCVRLWRSPGPGNGRVSIYLNVSRKLDEPCVLLNTLSHGAYPESHPRSHGRSRSKQGLAKTSMGEFARNPLGASGLSRNEATAADQEDNRPGRQSC